MQGVIIMKKRTAVKKPTSKKKSGIKRKAAGQPKFAKQKIVPKRKESAMSRKESARQDGARTMIPRSNENNYTNEMALKRREFIKEMTGVEVKHLANYSFDPQILKNNLENFFGVAQIPVGLAGPLLVNGEHAKGEFYVPLATTEGTLVASYNRGMRLSHQCGGITTTVVDEAMNRAPVFCFDSAREAQKFSQWLKDNFDEVKAKAEATDPFCRLKLIEKYAVGKLLYTRFDYVTGDAAGQNMVGKATFAVCEWLKSIIPDIKQYYLSGNIDTDKKHSFMNSLHTRGKRVIAEVTIPNEAYITISKNITREMFRFRNIANTGAILAGSNNNGQHAANGITAMFIACGMDVANVAESSAAVLYSDLLPDGSYYYSITIPSLIVGTYGGGTALPTQTECRKILGCDGKNTANKLAEIIAATVLCGEISLGAAIIGKHWVSSHEKYGRNF
jgi:hydroxymethylglutaryl-CoA reductase (NADPH)